MAASRQLPAQQDSAYSLWRNQSIPLPFSDHYNLDDESMNVWIYTLCIDTPMEWFHELDCGKSFDVELGTQCSVCLIITVDGCEGEYPGHMFGCLGIRWSKVLAVTTPTSVSPAIGV
jgi:hypothetical protein